MGINEPNTWRHNLTPKNGGYSGYFQIGSASYIDVTQ